MFGALVLGTLSSPRQSKHLVLLVLSATTAILSVSLQWSGRRKLSEPKGHVVYKCRVLIALIHINPSSGQQLFQLNQVENTLFLYFKILILNF